MPDASELDGDPHDDPSRLRLVQDEPVDELPPERVSELLRRHWEIEASEVRYAPVGRGSHHWIAGDSRAPAWFITADRLSCGRFAELSASAQTARHLANEGCDFVLAPIPDRTNTLVRTVQSGWAMQVLPYLRGWSTDQGAFTDPHEQREIAHMVGRVHAVAPPTAVPRWDPTPLYRSEIESALHNLDRPWPQARYAEQTRAVLTKNRTHVQDLLDEYDALLAAITQDCDPWVLTHGEPDSDNVVRTDNGHMYLIDWTSVAIAPRERDLFDVLQGPADVMTAYQQAAGPHNARPAAMTMIGLYWRLSHLGHDVKRLRRSEAPDLTAAWERLHKRLARAPSHDPAT